MQQPTALLGLVLLALVAIGACTPSIDLNFYVTAANDRSERADASALAEPDLTTASTAQYAEWLRGDLAIAATLRAETAQDAQRLSDELSNVRGEEREIAALLLTSLGADRDCFAAQVAAGRALLAAYEAVADEEAADYLDTATAALEEADAAAAAMNTACIRAEAATHAFNAAIDADDRDAWLRE